MNYNEVLIIIIIIIKFIRDEREMDAFKKFKS